MLETCHDGFEISERDLSMRGAGQVFGSGTKQSGERGAGRAMTLSYMYSMHVLPPPPSGGLDAPDLCERLIAVDPSIVEGARAAAAVVLSSLKSEGSDSASVAIFPSQTGISQLGAVVSAFKVRVFDRHRSSQDCKDFGYLRSSIPAFTICLLTHDN